MRFTVAGLMMVAVACAGPQRSVKREDPRTQRELTGNWSSTDAHETADALIKDCFATAWLPDFTKEQGRKPRIRVLAITNKTDEHIDAQTFIKSIEAAMVNSGKVSVLAQKGTETDAVREEQDDAVGGRVDEGASVGNEKGADFVVVVRMTSILDQVEGEKVKFYKINFELLHSTTKEKVWIGDHEIQKHITQASAGW